MTVMDQGKNRRHPLAANQTPNTHSPRLLKPAAVQRKTADSMMRPPPVAPPVYRPQPLPRVLQTKKSAPEIISQPGMNNRRPPEIVKRIVLPTRAAATRPRLKETTVQPFASRVVQATKFYPNLHPGAVESVDPSNIFRLDSFADQYRLHKVKSHGVNVPNQQYNFVRTREGEMLLHSRYRHPSIAEGKQVLYAGEIFFNNGKLKWWSNGSGHYQPYVEDAEQANLPMDHFFSFQQIMKGEHTRKKG